jgi:magnesium-transporting ATPase (P-type)
VRVPCDTADVLLAHGHRASDFAIRTFRHITRLLCVHGRYSMIRNSLLIHYAFYKNAAVFLVLVWLAFFSGFSAQVLHV